MTASGTPVSSARRPGIAPGREALAAALLFAAGLGVRLALTGSVSVTGDGPRFLAQAGDLRAGAAYVIPRDPFSTLPPGYPLFIRAVGVVAGGVEPLRRVQLVLSILTLLLVWLAARRRSREGALVDEILRVDVPHPFLPTLIGLSGRRFATVPIERATRPGGGSAYTRSSRLLRAAREVAFVFRRRSAC